MPGPEDLAAGHEERGDVVAEPVQRGLGDTGGGAQPLEAVSGLACSELDGLVM